MQFEPNGNGKNYAVLFTRCALCGEIGYLHDMTIEHRIPRWKWKKLRRETNNKLPVFGGVLPNISLSHYLCNLKKSQLLDNPQHGIKQKKSLLKRIGKFYGVACNQILRRKNMLKHKLKEVLFGWIKPCLQYRAQSVAPVSASTPDSSDKMRSHVSQKDGTQ